MKKRPGETAQDIDPAKKAPKRLAALLWGAVASWRTAPGPGGQLVPLLREIG